VEKVEELDSQKNQTEKAFHGFLPPALVRDLKREQSYIEEFESVTIFYGYILGFSELVADCSPTEVMVEARGPLIS